ncbi:arginase family protein, partial [Salmonella enterica subsp. enterica serovar Virginia]|nr:arginase family protein [Salmonella enterica subsp. enterica serovar Virginia]
MRTLVLGGGHETAFGHGAGVLDAFAQESVGIINLDAHLDLRQIHLPQFLRAFVKLPVINVAKIIIDATIAAGGDKALEADNAHF